MKYLIPLLFLFHSCTFAEWMCAVQGDCTLVEEQCDQLDSTQVLTLRDSFQFTDRVDVHRISKPSFVHSAIPLQYESWYVTDTISFSDHQKAFNTISTTIYGQGGVQHIATNLEKEYWTDSVFKYVYPIGSGFLLRAKSSVNTFIHVTYDGCKYKAYGIFMKGSKIDHGEDVS